MVKRCATLSYRQFSSIGIYEQVTDEDRERANQLVNDFGLDKVADSTLHGGVVRR